MNSEAGNYTGIAVESWQQEQMRATGVTIQEQETKQSWRPLRAD
jgi:hypothetical protein